MKKLRNKNQITTTKDKAWLIAVGIVSVLAIIVISVLISNAGAVIEAGMM